MSHRRIFSLFLSVFLFCGLSGLSWAADLDAEDVKSQSLERSGCQVAARNSEAADSSFMVAGLFSNECFKVYKEEKEKAYNTTLQRELDLLKKIYIGTVWAKNCNAAIYATPLGGYATKMMGCEKIKAKDEADCKSKSRFDYSPY